MKMKKPILILALGGALLLAAVPARAQNPQTFTFQGNVFQTYTVPVSGTYLLSASGAQGGPASNNSHQGGWGAQMAGSVPLQAGDTLIIAVGGMGQQGANRGNNVSGGGGGGGSSIILSNATTYAPLVMAGGGGGAAAHYDGGPGLTTQNGACSNGGTGGSGGAVGSYKRGGAGGAGYYGDGGTHYDVSDCMSGGLLYTTWRSTSVLAVSAEELYKLFPALKQPGVENNATAEQRVIKKLLESCPLDELALMIERGFIYQGIVGWQFQE